MGSGLVSAIVASRRGAYGFERRLRPRIALVAGAGGLFTASLAGNPASTQSVRQVIWRVTIAEFNLTLALFTNGKRMAAERFANPDLIRRI